MDSRRDPVPGSEAGAKSTLNDLLETLKKLEEDEHLESPKPEKKNAWCKNLFPLYAYTNQYEMYVWHCISLIYDNDLYYLNTTHTMPMSGSLVYMNCTYTEHLLANYLQLKDIIVVFERYI